MERGRREEYSSGVSEAQIEVSQAHSVSDPDLADQHVSSEVYHPPVAIIRSRPEAASLGEEAIHCLSWGVIHKHTAGRG